MIELDRSLKKVSEVINKCYVSLFPNYPRFPQFTFTRAMITIWLDVIYAKLEPKLFDAFTDLFKEVSNNKLKGFSNNTITSYTTTMLLNGKISQNFPKEKRSELNKELLLNRYCRSLINRITQAIVDLSVHDLSIHFLGSTKFTTDGPYFGLHETILKLTK